MSLSGKRIVVTGGSAGLGAALAHHFAQAGARVVTGDIQKGGPDGLAAALNLDVTDPASVTDFMVDATEKLGGIDALINNAGTNGDCQLVEQMPLDAWNKTLTTNLTGTMLVSQAAIRHLKASHGNIVNVASNVARRGLPFRADYVCSKWAVLGLTQTLALELVEHEIRVNAICPGPVKGERIEALLANHARAEGKSIEEMRADWTMGAPMKRFIEPREVCEVAAFLLDDALSSAMTGQALNVTGGMIMT